MIKLLDPEYTVSIRIRNSKGSTVHWESRKLTISDMFEKDANVNDAFLHEINQLKCNLEDVMEADPEWVLKEEKPPPPSNFTF